MEIKYLISIIVVSGGVSGIILGITRTTSYTLTLPGGRNFPLGFFGDALVGSVAALAVFAVAGPIFNIEIDKLSEASELLKVLAVSIIAGFSGISLLSRLSESLIRKVDQVSKDVENIKALEQSNEFILTADFLRVNQDFEEAISQYDYALKLYPGNSSAKVGKAVSLRRINKVQEAFDTMEELTRSDPKNQKGWYNRACYGSLLNHDKESVFNDLRQSFSIFPQYKELAAKDPDFNRFKEDEDFKTLARV